MTAGPDPQQCLPFQPSPKLPAMPVYVGDWRKDPRVQALTYELKGIWFEILCLMWESEYRGKLLLNCAPMPEEALARALGVDKQTASNALSKLVAGGPAKREQATSIIFCDWMLEKEDKRREKVDAGRLGGLATQQARRLAEQEQLALYPSTSSVSVAVSSSQISNYSPEFEKFWREMPKRSGSNPKKLAWEKWNARRKEGVTENEMIEAAEHYADYSLAVGQIGTEYVMTGSSFLGPKSEGWKQDWTPPQPTPTVRGTSGSADGAVLDPKFSDPTLVPVIEERQAAVSGDGGGNISEVSEKILKRAKEATGP